MTVASPQTPPAAMNPLRRLSVIIPVYNEHRTIEAVIAKVRAVDTGCEKELVIVDGNSIDGTREILRRYEKDADVILLLQDAPRGRGNAIKAGLERATGEVVIFQDADLELDPDDYPWLLEPIRSGETEVVFGSRFLRRQPLPMGFLQLLGNRVITGLVNLLYRSRLTDVETCYQVFRREALRNIRIERNDFGMTVELTVKLLREKHRIVEIPVRYIPRGKPDGKKIYWADGFVALWVIVAGRLGR